MTRIPDYVKAGDRPEKRATDHNAMTETVRRFRKTKTSGGRSRYSEPPGTVLVKNVGPHYFGELDAFEITGSPFSYYDDPDEFKNNVVLEVDMPTTTGTGKWVVCAEGQIDPGKTGLAYIDGVFPAFVMIDDAFHRFCDIDRENGLRSFGGGAAEILHRDAANVSPVPCILRMNSGYQHGVGVADADIAKGATGTISVWHNTSYGIGNEEDSGENITALARMGDITAGDDVLWKWTNGLWEVYQAECNG